MTIWRDLQFSAEKRPWTLSPLVVCRGTCSSWTWARLFERSIAYCRGCYMISLIYYFYHLRCLCIEFNVLSALVGCCSSVFIMRITYKVFNCVSFWLHSFWSEYEGRIPLMGLTRVIGVFGGVCVLLFFFANVNLNMNIMPYGKFLKLFNKFIYNLILFRHSEKWVNFSLSPMTKAPIPTENSK